MFNYEGKRDIHTSFEFRRPHHSLTHHPIRMEKYDVDALTLERMKSPFYVRILNNTIPRCLEKPPNLHSYNGVRDPYEHVEHVDN